MNLFDPTFILTLILLAAVVVIAVFVWKLHQQGVPNNQLARQTQLKGADLLDQMQERMTAALHDWAEAHPASMGSAYFDRDDFMQQIGRLPATHKQAISLDGAIVRNGDLPPLAYVTQANGNVSKA